VLNKYRRYALEKLSTVGPKYMPFADVATADVPLSRLLRLSLFQVTVGMALVLLVGTLNRVMIVELSVPATLVGVMLALPIVFAPFRVLIGFKSDTHISALGWRRVPFIWKGTMLQFGGFAIMPFALLVLSGYREAADAPLWIGHSSAALAFLLVGAGVHTVQTAGLALATDLVRTEDQPKVVGLMYVALLVGMIVSALAFGALLENYSPGRLIQCIQGAAVVTIALNMVAIWKQEPRDRVRAHSKAPKQKFDESWRAFARNAGALRLLIIIGLGTAGFGMADVLIEPFGGQALGMSVAATTKLTAVMAFGGLIGFGIASKVLSGADGSPSVIANTGALIGVPAFFGIIATLYVPSVALFVLAVLFLGLGAGLFGHGTLTATMRAAPKEQVGLALGTWGAVQATAAGLAVAIGGIMRDLITGWSAAGQANAANAYLPVFMLEIVLLIAACIVLAPMMAKRAKPRQNATRAYVKREAS
jgi:BCD family chlorophyll transporter-like MFS transporter